MHAAIRTVFFVTALCGLCACEENPIETATETQREALRTSKDKVERAIGQRQDALRTSVESATGEEARGAGVPADSEIRP